MLWKTGSASYNLRTAIFSVFKEYFRVTFVIFWIITMAVGIEKRNKTITDHFTGNKLLIIPLHVLHINGDENLKKICKLYVANTTDNTLGAVMSLFYVRRSSNRTLQ